MKTARELFEDLSKLFDNIGAGKVGPETARAQMAVANGLMRMAELQRKVGGPVRKDMLFLSPGDAS